MKCSFSGCNSVAVTARFCPAHYQQKRLGKTLKKLQTQYHGLSEKDRFLKRVSSSEGCWHWTGSLDQNGYGQFRNAKGIRELVHRASWRLFTGTEAGKLCVLHKCDVPRCVNPEHLFLGTQRDNIKDMHSKGRAKQGHLHGSKSPNAKLTEELVKMIRNSDKPVLRLAKENGVSRAVIYDIKQKKTWKHVL